MFKGGTPDQAGLEWPLNAANQLATNRRAGIETDISNGWFWASQLH